MFYTQSIFSSPRFIPSPYFILSPQSVVGSPWSMFYTDRLANRVYGKRQSWICTTWPRFPLTCRLLFILTARKSVDSHQFYTEELFEPVLTCSFSIWEFLNLPFAVNVTLKVFTNETFHQHKRNKKCRTPLPSFPRFPPLPHRPQSRCG